MRTNSNELREIMVKHVKEHSDLASYGVAEGDYVALLQIKRDEVHDPKEETITFREAGIRQANGAWYLCGDYEITEFFVSNFGWDENRLDKLDVYEIYRTLIGQAYEDIIAGKFKEVESK